MQLKGAMSLQLGKSACQPTQLPLQLAQLTFILSGDETYSTCVCIPTFTFLHLVNDLMSTEDDENPPKLRHLTSSDFFGAVGG